MSRTKKAAQRAMEEEAKAREEKERAARAQEAAGNDAELEANDPDSMADDSSDDSDDSSSGDVDVNAETAQQLMALEQELQTNPSYEKHLEYIALLRTTPGLRTRLHDAHEALAARYPLSEELWLAWVNDELAGVAGPEDVERLLGLLRLAATRDYLAPGVWELYLDVAYDLDPSVRDLEAEGVDRYRGLCEEALAAAGLHLAAGHRLWEKYRKFELAVEAKLAEGGKGSGVAATKQQDRVRALYQRQLQVPLQDVAQTLEEYKAWEAGHGKSVPPHVVKAADKAREAAELRSGCEACVAPEVPADVAKLGAFLSYIKMEQNAGDTARVQVMYERAVAAFPLTHSLWLQYGQYMETHTKVPGPINDVYGRAVRNCPWVGAVWERAIRALDRTAADVKAVDETYGRALQAGLQNAEDYLAVILARIDYLRRAAAPTASTTAGASGAANKKAAAAAFTRLREAFRSAGELMTSLFPEHVDRALRLPAYWAHCEVHLMENLAGAREVWEGALKGGLSRYAEAWEAYIAMERDQRMLKEARALYKRCYSRRFEEDGQMRLCHAWLRFEREEGSADDYLQALLKVEPILEEMAAAAAAAADQTAAAAAKAAVQKATNLSKEEVKAMRQAKDPNYLKAKADKVEKGKKDKGEKGGKSSKRLRQDGEEEAAATADEGEAAAPLTASKRVRTQEPTEGPTAGAAAAEHPPTHDDAGQAHGDAEMADQGNAGAVEPGPEEHEERGAAEGDEQHEAGPGPSTTSITTGPRPHYTDKMTVFVRGLRHGVKDGELDAFLKQHVAEGVKEIRLMRDQQTGQARGFAYVECGSREVLDKAVALNGISFQGQELFIAESKPPGHGPGGRGAGGRFGGPPGRGRFSGPPGGRGGFGGRGRFGGGWGRGSEGGDGGDGDTEMADAGGSGGGRGGYGGRHPGLGHPKGRGHMRTHLQVAQGRGNPTALVPRSVQLARGGAGGSGGGPEGGAAEGGASGGQPMSNEDFRKMLLGGKK